MATIFVTGGAGFIGSNFVRYWLSKYPGDSVINYDALTYAGTLTSLADVERDYGDRYRFVRGDIGNYDLVAHLFRAHRPDAVVNFAAESHNSRAVINPAIFYQTNVLGTQRLLQAAMDARVPRINHVSTCEVYGDLPLDSPESFSETSPLKPRTHYNASKAGSDLVVHAYWESYRLPVTITNCSNNYGPYQFPEKLIPHNVARLLTGKKMTLYRSSTHKREWLHVLDHCRAIEMVLERGRLGESYNIGSGEEADVETIAAVILDELGLDDSYKEYVPDRPGHDRRYLLDASKIRRELGWQPEIPLDKGLRETIRWYVDNRDWWEPLLERTIDESSWGR